MSTLNFVEEIHHVAGLDLAVRRWGKEGDEPIIALHGWMDNAASYDRIAPSLVGYCVYALDFPGHGLSSHRPVGACYNIWDYVADEETADVDLIFDNVSSTDGTATLDVDGHTVHFTPGLNFNGTADVNFDVTDTDATPANVIWSRAISDRSNPMLRNRRQAPTSAGQNENSP